MKIVFMGTPDFAVPSLEILVENGYDVVGVVTVPDKPSGRGLKVSQSAVKQYALSKDLKVLQPEKLKDADFLTELDSLGADLFVVVAFRILPEVVWSMPPKGTFNLHGSLLPDYRGAGPINWAVLNGEAETGVTTFFLKQKVDTGDIIDQTAMPIFEDETAGELHDRMMDVGADLVLKTVKAIEAGNATSKPQVLGREPKMAPKIFKPDCRIDWTRGVDELHNFIRGLSPYPTAWTELDGKSLKIFMAAKIAEEHSLEVGSVDTDGKTYIKVAASNGFLSLKEIQLQGKKRMKVEDFLRGARLENVKMV